MARSNAPKLAFTARKPCIACREMIPVDATVCARCHQSQIPEKPVSFKKITGWAAGITVLIGIFASLFGGLQWVKEHWTRHSDVKAELAVAESQTARGEYETAVATYADILKKDPHNQQASDQQINATMLWVENFHALTHEGENTRDIAAPKLDAIMPILDSALTRAKGKRAADILAHIGWTHWLNWHIAEREISPVAEESFRKALAIDRANVYANAMLGNWLLQNKGSMQEAFSHFATAVQSGEERAWVRRLQVGGLIYNEAPEARVELVKVVNDMRKNNESLSEDDKDRILGFNYSVSPDDSQELALSLSAVPPDDSWATYQWLDDDKDREPSDLESHQLHGDYIHAKILDLSGNKPEALSQYKALQTKLTKLKDPEYGTLADQAKDAIRRLGKN